jgi:hypothetical protein
MSCYETLEELGYNLRGYSPDTIITLLQESLPPAECKSLLARLEVEYG